MTHDASPSQHCLVNRPQLGRAERGLELAQPFGAQVAAAVHPGVIAQQYPGVRYRAFDLFEPGRPRMHQYMLDLAELFDAGVLRPLPVTTFDIRRAPAALREAARALLPQHGLAGVDYVFVARPATAVAPWAALLDDVGKALISVRADLRAGPP